ncbi:MAG: OsmC family protein [Nitrospinota bacterium]
MTGNLGGALEARGIPSHPDKLSSEVEGYIEKVDGQAVITRIRVKYHVNVPKGKKEEAERALEIHESKCAASQSVRRGIAIEWEGEIEEE